MLSPIPFFILILSCQEIIILFCVAEEKPYNRKIDIGAGIFNWSLADCFEDYRFLLFLSGCSYLIILFFSIFLSPMEAYISLVRSHCRLAKVLGLIGRIMI